MTDMTFSVGTGVPEDGTAGEASEDVWPTVSFASSGGSSVTTPSSTVAFGEAEPVVRVSLVVASSSTVPFTEGELACLTSSFSRLELLSSPSVPSVLLSSVKLLVQSVNLAQGVTTLKHTRFHCR